MNNKIKANSSLKPVCSVIDMARQLGLSRARFYQLLEQGIFPQAVYCLRTHRPLYLLEQQQICLNIKETNIGYNGQYVLFYSPRKIVSEQNLAATKKSKPKNDTFSEIAETLNRMGLSLTADKVSEAVENLYPDGVEGKDHGVLIRDLFRFFKNGA